MKRPHPYLPSLILFLDSARLHPGEINSHVAQAKPVWWSLHTDAHEIWCRDSDRGTSLGRSIPRPPVLCSMRKIHLRPQVVRPTSPRNISNPTCSSYWMLLKFPLQMQEKCPTLSVCLIVTAKIKSDTLNFLM
nr:embryonic stem cell-related gene protein-like [Gorilla gorilla gorilla]